MKRLSSLIFASGLIGIFSLGVLWAAAAQADSAKKFTLDVAMGDAPVGVNLSNPEIPDTATDGRGIVVLSSGNIFPGGTLLSDEIVFDPNDSSSIGIWRCHLAALGGKDFPLTGAVTYFFELSTEHDPKGSMIIVQGLNSHPMNPGAFGDSIPRVHAVVGGTGKYAGVSGEVTETVVGTNSVSRNLRFDFRLRNVGDDDDDNDDDDDDDD